MRLTKKNTYIAKHEDGYSIFIEIPDGSRNYLHCKKTDLESAIIIQDLLFDTTIEESNLEIIVDESYYRLHAKIKNINEDVTKFHSRKLNLNDVLNERQLLLDVE